MINGEQEVLANPYQRLMCRSEKDAINMNEMHLGDLGITALGSDFGKFLNLDTLWLNGNRLADIDGLETNFRIKCLYLHNNRLGAFKDGCFAPFLFLNKLTLNDNRLTDLDTMLSELKRLAYLRHLDLYNNPCEQEDNYRLRVIGEMPFLDILDRHTITDAERHEANFLKIRLAKMASLLNSTKRKTAAVDRKTVDMEYAGRLESAKKKFLPLIELGRIFLEADYAAIDKRGLGLVMTDDFWDVLTSRNLASLLTDEERETIDEEYRGTFQVHGISKTGTVAFPGINYRRFARDFLPKELRSAKDSWRFEPCPEVSLTTQDLTRFVAAVNRKKQQQEELKRQQMISGAKTSPVKFGSAEARTYNACERHGLSPWVSSEIYRIFKQMEADGSTTLTAENIDAFLRQITVYGKIPEMGIRETRERLLRGRETAPLGELREALGCLVHKKGANNSSTSQAGEDLFLVRFRDLTANELQRLGSRLYEEADGQLDTLLRATAATDTAPLVMQTSLSAINATRVLTKASLLASSSSSQQLLSPTSQAKKQAALNRSDIFSIPNIYGQPGPGSERAVAIVGPHILEAPAAGGHHGKTGTKKSIPGGKNNHNRNNNNSTGSDDSSIKGDEEGRSDNGPSKGMAEWAREFRALGMKGDILEVALDRKQRSIIAAANKR